MGCDGGAKETTANPESSTIAAILSQQSKITSIGDGPIGQKRKIDGEKFHGESWQYSVNLPIPTSKTDGRWTTEITVFFPQPNSRRLSPGIQIFINSAGEEKFLTHDGFKISGILNEIRRQMDLTKESE